MLFDPLLIAFIIMGCGFAFQRLVGFDQKSCADILVYLTGPALIFYSIYSKKLVFGELLLLGGGAIFIILISGLFAFLAFRAIKYKNNGMLLPAMFMNSGYLGYPIALFALGELGLQKAIIFDAVETLLNFTLGVFLVQKATDWKERIAGIFRLPLVYAISFGILLNFASFPLPKLALDSLSLIGSATIPLALVTLGGRLATLKIGSLKVPMVAVFSRLLVGGVAGLAFVKLFNITGVLASVILLLAVMPPAVNSYVLNEKFSKDPENAATSVIIGTVLSIIPILFVLSLI